MRVRHHPETTPQSQQREVESISDSSVLCRKAWYNTGMKSSITNEQQQALDQNDGIVETGDVVFMRIDVFRDMLGFTSDDELRQQLKIGFDQADRGQLVDWNPDKIKAEGRRRLQKQQDAS